MLDGSDAHYEQVQDDVEARTENIDIRSILGRSDLPAEVRNAKIHYQVERLMDADLLEFLTIGNQGESRPDEPGQRIGKRCSALARYLDANLVCLTIRLPGVLYTIEIDPESRAIVHWEWQEM